MWTSEPRGGETAVIGLGNPLMGDDALGLIVLEQLRARFALPDEVALVDGGTWGLSLLPTVEDARRVLFVDAVRSGARPGTLVVLRDEEIPARLSRKLSPHQVDLSEVIAVARLRGRMPGETVVAGLEPERIELGEPLSPAVDAQLERLLDTVVQLLGSWGYACAPRTEAAPCTS